MSFLSQINNQKSKLKETETIVTAADGKRTILGKNGEIPLKNTLGFVVDTSPDYTPAQIIDHLYIGSQDSTDSKVIQEYKIRRVISVGIETQIPNVTYKYVPCLDLPESDIKLVLQEALPFINEGLKLNENVLVHCNAGVSRTGMVAIGYLMHYEKMSCVDAYSLVKSKRPVVQPNAGFVRKLSVLKPGHVIDE